MTRFIPPIPQTGRHPIMLASEQEERLLSRRVAADRSDPFAADSDDAVRKLGRLSLRRGEKDPNDYFALGDLCARLSLGGENLYILYIGKTLLAYQRVRQMSSTTPIPSSEREAADRAIVNYVQWVMNVAVAVPNPRNVAAALWAAAEIPPERQEPAFRDTARALARLSTEYYTESDEMPVSKAAQIRETVEAPVVAPSQPGQPAVAQPAELKIPQKSIPGEPLPDGSNKILQPDLLDTQPDFVVETQFDEDAAGIVDTAGRQPVPDIGLMTEESDIQPLGVIESAEPLRSGLASAPSAALAAPAVILPEEDQDQHTGDFRLGDALLDRGRERYEIRHILRGGMGIIYLCYDRENRNTVAIKTFQGRFLDNKRATERFVQEALTWVRLEKHRNIVQAGKVQSFGGGRVRERPHILLEYVAGPEGLGSDLKGWIEHNRLDVPTTLQIGLDICRGMQHATRMVPGLVHRDLKPANILVRHDGLAKVTDFGLARSLDDAPGLSVTSDEAIPAGESRLTRAGAIVGTAPYMSPEQCRAEEVDLRSDIYAFGAILYEMVTGRQLFEARTLSEWISAHVNQPPEFDLDALARVPTGLSDLIARCLAKQREQRPAGWDTLAAELAALYRTATGSSVVETADELMEFDELMDKAYALTELGKGEEALPVYDRVLELQPGSARAWARKGRLLRILSRPEEGLGCCEKALQIDPKSAFAWRQQGILLEQLGRTARALEAYRMAASLAPRDIWPVYNQAKLLLGEGQTQAALRKFEVVLTLDPRHARSHARRGQALNTLGDQLEAIAAYNRAIDLDPDYGWGWFGKGIALRAAERSEEALTVFMRATRLMPEEAAPWRALADTLIDLKRHTEALPVARQLTQLDPDSENAWSRFGKVLFNLERYDEAVEAYDHALILRFDSTWALSGKAAALERLGKRAEALALYEEVTRIEPNKAWGWQDRGRTLMTLGRTDEAIEMFRQAVRVEPDSARAWANLGSACAHGGKPKQALVYFNRALHLSPNTAWVWKEKAQALEALGRDDEALDAYRGAITAAPDDAQYEHDYAGALIHMGRYADALAALEPMRTRSPDDRAVWFKLGRACRLAGRLDGALDAFSHAMDIGPRDGPIWNEQGLTLSALGRREEALECFRRAVEERPIAWHWYNLADELIKLERYEEALDALDSALAQDERHSPSWATRGLALRRLGRYREALIAYDKALALNPRYAWAWNGRGLALEQMGRREEAIGSYERAVQEDPTDLWYRINQIEPLLALGRREDALDVCDETIKALPESAIPWARKGQVLRRLSRHEEAIEAYNEALRINPHYAWAWNGKGLACTVLERWKEALACYERAIQEDESDVWFWHNRGEALLELGRFEEAITVLNRALEIDPRHELSRIKRTEARRRLTGTDEK